MVERLFDKISIGGVVLSALGCAGCFPALGVLGLSLGLGFLTQYEGVLINRVLPLFAVLALLANSYSWSKHRVHYRGILSLIGPVTVLAVLYPLWEYSWSTPLFYSALVLMLLVSVADLIRPPAKPCCKKGVSA